MNQRFIKLNREDVVSTQEQDLVLFNKTFTVQEFVSHLKKILMDKIKLIQGKNAEGKESIKLTKEGIKCQVLSPNDTWKTGKIRITLEFIPDESESPLDDVRQDNSNHEE